MKHFLQFYFFSLVCTITSYAQLSGSYTINSNLLTSATNFQSFGDFTTALAIQGVNSPVNVNVVNGSGPYYEQVIFDPYAGASAQNRVTIFGNGETVEYNPGNGFVDLRIVGFTANTKYITLDSLTIVGDKGVGVAFDNGTDFNIVRNCTIVLDQFNQFNNTIGIAIGSCDNQNLNACPWGANASNILIENNLIIGSAIRGPEYGIKFNSDLASGNGKNNIIRNNTIKDFLLTGIYVHNQDSILIENNRIFKEFYDRNYYCYGIYISGTNNLEDVKVQNNEIFNLKSTRFSSGNYPIYGIYNNASGTATSPIKIQNNLIRDLEFTNDIVYGIYNVNGQNIDYFHNTISINDSRSTTSDKYGIYQSGNYDSVNVKNNNVLFNSMNTGNNVGFYFEGNPSNFTCDFNNAYLKSQGVNNYYGSFNGNNSRYLADWQLNGNNTFGINSLSEDPLFISSTNLIPRSQKLNNTGIDVGVALDIEDVIRNTPPDIGAFEFNCGLPTNIQIKQFSDTSVLISWDSIPNHNQQWEIMYSKYNFIPNNTSSRTTIVGGRTSAILSPLEFDQTYNYYIRTICGMVDTSLWSDKLVFKKTFPALNGNYTINSTLPTFKRNFNSFKDFTERLTDVGVNDTVVVDVVSGTGPYYEQVIFKSIKGQSLFHPIIINGNNEIISHAPTSSDRRVVGFESAKHITLTNLEIRIHSSNYGYGIHFLSKSDSNTVRNCNIILESNFLSSNKGLIGIYSSSFIDRYITSSNYTTASNLKIIDNTITSGIDSSLMIGISLVGNRYGIVSERSSSSIIQGNDIKGFNREGISLNFQFETKIISNKISSPHKNRNYDLFGISVEAERDDINCKVEKNNIYNLLSSNNISAIYFKNPSTNPFSKVSISNNLIHSIKADNRIFAIEVNGGNEIDVYHNTIAINDSSTNSCFVLGVSVSTNTSRNHILDLRNNIITITHGGSGNKLFFTSNGRVDGQLKSNNNCFFYGNIGTNNNFCSASTPLNSARTYTSLQDWLNSNSSHFDRESMNKRPYFISSTNYKPSNLALSSAGVNVFELEDFYGNYRDSTPDIGAINLAPNITLPFYPISKITTKDSTDMLDSLGVFCKTSGVAHGINFKKSNGLDFYLVDQNNLGQSSIRVSSNFNTSNYYFSEGDSIEVEGQLQQILGQPHILVSTIRIVRNSSKALNSTLVDKPSKMVEGKIIELTDVKLLDSNQNQTYTLRALNSFGDTVLIQIDSLTDLNDSLNRVGFVPNDSICSIVGICAQRGTSQSYSTKYYILPLRFADIDTVTCIETPFHQEPKDTIRLKLKNCLDSNFFSYKMDNLTNKNLKWNIFTQLSKIEDNFNQGLNSIWEDSVGVSILNNCGTIDSSSALTFNGVTNKRFIESYPLNLSCKSEIKVSVNKGGDCYNGTFNDNQQLKIQFSTNFGVSWRTISTIKSSGNFTFIIPDTAKVNLTKLRFIQVNSTGNNMQVWLLDNFKIENESMNCTQNLILNQSEGTIDASNQTTIAGSINLEKLDRGLNYYPVPIYTKLVEGNSIKYLILEIDYINDFCIDFDFNALSCGSSYRFANLTQGENLSYEWSFEGTSIKKKDKNPTHFFGTDGIKTVMLKVCDGFTCDSIIKQIYIDNNFGPSEPACTAIYPNVSFGGNSFVGAVRMIDLTERDTAKFYYYAMDSNISDYMPNSDLSCKIKFHLNKDNRYYLEYAGGRSGNTNRMTFYTWIDYNNDSFLDSNERILAGSSGTYGDVVFDVPNSAVLNTPLRMRLIVTMSVVGQPFYDIIDCNSEIKHHHFKRDHTVIITDSSAFYKPVSDFLFYQNDCFNEVEFESTTSNLPTSYLWDFGDGNTSISSSFKHTYSDAGSYQVKLITSNDYGVDSISKTIQIKKPVNQIIFTGQLLTHCPIQFEVKDNSNLIQTTWDFGNQKSNAGGTVVHTYSNRGVFEVNLTTIDSNFCVLEYKDTLRVIGFKDSISACKEYTWKDGITYFENNRTATYIFGTNPNGCDSIVSLDLKIANIDTSLKMTGQTLAVNADSVSTFQWLSCSGGSFSALSNETTSMYTPTNDGYFACEITYNGCKDTTRCELVLLPISTNAAFTNNPNPTLGDVTFESTSASDLDDIFIRNSFGQIVYKKTSIKSKLIIVPTSSWKPGIYNVIVTIAGNSHSSKIVVI